MAHHGIDVSDLRNSIKFPSNLSTPLSKFFEEATYTVEEIINSIEVGTGRKQPGKNETYFKFTSQENQQASSKYVKIIPRNKQITMNLEIFYIFR